MGYKENQRRDAEAKAKVQKLRDERDAQTRADWLSGPTKRELDLIAQQAAARKAAQSGSCMMARTTVAMLGLAVVVLNGMARNNPVDDSCTAPSPNR
jgi:uncharacterized membrane protein